MFLNKKIAALIGKDKIHKFYKLVVFTIFIAVIETAGIGMVIPLIQIILNPEYIEKIKDFIPFFSDYTDRRIILSFLLLLWLIFIIKNFLYMTYIYISNKFNQNIRKDLATKLYYNFLNQKYNFHLSTSSVELIKNINIDLEDLRFSLAHFFIGVAEIFICISLVVLLLTFDFYTTTILITVFLAIVILYNLFLRDISKKMGENIYNSMTHLQRHVKETLSNIKIIKIFSSKKHFEEEFDTYNKKYVHSRLMIDVIVNAPRAVIESTVVTLLVFYFFFAYSSSNSLTAFSSIGLYGLAFFRLMPAVNRLVTAFSYRDILQHNTNKLYEIFVSSNINEESYNQNSKLDKKNYSAIDSIKLENVTFSYDGNKKILDNVDLQINKNEFIGIIGESGTGKSTLLNLLLGLLQPNKGSIQYNNNIDIFENLQSFNKKISYVPQNITILEKSLKENIAFGEKKENIDLEKIKTIVKKTKLDNLINQMDDGLDSIINTDNLNISGGELQRVGLARALYFDSDLLILDEATNSLDIKTENEILDMIYENFLGKKIIVFITHKIKNLEKTDYIVEIKDKKIIKKRND
mgnify:FL=1|tara:strand:+ start:12375 stop:14108 length:1734 start_codon:yes stop_codon:yes gene_type:complete